MNGRIISGIFAALLLFSVPAYAMPPVAKAVSTANNDTSIVSDVNAGSAEVHVRTTAAVEYQWKSERAKRLYEMLRERIGEEKLREMREKGIDPEEFVNKVIERRREAARAVIVSRDQIRKWVEITKKYRLAVEKIKKATLRFAEKQREWAEYKRRYEDGEISEEDYLQKSKEMILAAIDATIERLESVKDVVADPSAVDDAIARLQELRSEVDAAESLDELRAIYKEDVLPTLRQYHRRLFAKYYIVGTINAAESIVHRLDAAAARLTRYVELAKRRGIYDEEMDARVNEIFAEIEAVKAELESLKAEVEAKDIDSPQEYISKINDIKRDVVEIYRDIRDLIVDYNKKIAQRVRERVRTEETTGDHGEQGTTEVEIEQETNVQITGKEGNVGIETNVSVEVNE